MMVLMNLVELRASEGSCSVDFEDSKVMQSSLALVMCDSRFAECRHNYRYFVYNR